MEYDAVARSTWNERAKQNIDGFDVNVACLAIDRDLLEIAEANMNKRSSDNKDGKDKNNKVCSLVIRCRF